jgi:nitrogen fixation NifU-like protein
MFSAAVMDHVNRRRNCGPLAGATHHGVAGCPGDGPYAEIWLRVEGAKIESAAYATYGCASAIACGSMTAEIVTGRTIEQARRLNARDIVLLLGGIPEGKEHCASLAAEALQRALPAAN